MTKLLSCVIFIRRWILHNPMQHQHAIYKRKVFLLTIVHSSGVCDNRCHRHRKRLQ
jgi:hypothetical protein